MKLFKKLSFVALTVAALGGGVASASAIEHVRTEEEAAPPPNKSVPEPGSMVLLGLGCAGLAAVRRRKR